MYVCVCKAVTEKQLAAAVHAGARNLRTLRHTLGITSECGRCACFAQQCLRECLAQTDDETQASAHLPVAASVRLNFSLEAA